MSGEISDNINLKCFMRYCVRRRIESSKIPLSLFLCFFLFVSLLGENLKSELLKSFMIISAVYVKK